MVSASPKHRTLFLELNYYMEARGRTSNLSSACHVACLSALNIEMPVVSLSFKHLPLPACCVGTPLSIRDLSGGGHTQFRN